MTDKELFGISEQLDDTISRREALDALTKQADEMSRWCERYQEQRKGVLTARNIIKDLPSAQQWIPCSERLPEEEKVYLVTFAIEKVGMSSWHKDTFNRGFNRGFDVYLTGVTEDGECEYFGVVAWMEKPEPWKGGPDEH